MSDLDRFVQQLAELKYEVEDNDSCDHKDKHKWTIFLQTCLCCTEDERKLQPWTKTVQCDDCHCSFSASLECGGHYENIRLFDSTTGQLIPTDYMRQKPLQLFSAGILVKDLMGHLSKLDPESAVLVSCPDYYRNEHFYHLDVSEPPTTFHNQTLSNRKRHLTFCDDSIEKSPDSQTDKDGDTDQDKNKTETNDKSNQGLSNFLEPLSKRTKISIVSFRTRAVEHIVDESN